MNKKLIRDALGSPVPQYFNEGLGMYAVNTLEGSTVTNGDINFSQTKLLRDKMGSVIPQVWDSVNQKWVVVTTQSSLGNGEGSRTFHTSTVDPTNEDGNDGDIWIKYKEASD